MGREAKKTPTGRGRPCRGPLAASSRFPGDNHGETTSAAPSRSNVVPYGAERSRSRSRAQRPAFASASWTAQPSDHRRVQAQVLDAASLVKTGPIGATEGSEDIPLSGRERAEGFLRHDGSKNAPNPSSNPTPEIHPT